MKEFFLDIMRMVSDLIGNFREIIAITVAFFIVTLILLAMAFFVLYSVNRIVEYVL